MRRVAPVPLIAHTSAINARQGEPYRYFTYALALLLFGYMFFNKSFAYLHVPGLPIYVGEMVLALGFMEAARLHVPWSRLVASSPVLKALTAFMALCAVRLLFDLPHYRIMAIRDSAIWYYGAFAFLVCAAAVRDRHFVIRLLTWYRAVLPAFLVWAPLTLAVERIGMLSGIMVPDSTIEITFYKQGDYAVHVIMALSYLWLGVDRLRGTDPNPRSELVLSAMGLVALIVLATDTRSGIVAAGLAGILLLTYLPAARRTRIGFPVAATVMVAVAIVMLLDIRVSTGEGDVSLQQVASDFNAIVARDQRQASGTIEWRERLWTQTVDDLSDSDAWLVGLGYGPVLPNRYDIELDAANPQVLRNAHNSHLTLMARSGYPGLALWVLLWAVWIAFLTRRMRWYGGVRRPHAAFIGWLMIASVAFLTNAFFDPSLEGPQSGIWLFTIVGLGAAATRFSAQRNSIRGSTPLSVVDGA